MITRFSFFLTQLNYFISRAGCSDNRNWKTVSSPWLNAFTASSVCNAVVSLCTTHCAYSACYLCARQGVLMDLGPTGGKASRKEQNQKLGSVECMWTVLKTPVTQVLWALTRVHWPEFSREVWSRQESLWLAKVLNILWLEKNFKVLTKAAANYQETETHKGHHRVAFITWITGMSWWAGLQADHPPRLCITLHGLLITFTLGTGLWKGCSEIGVSEETLNGDASQQ